MGRWRPIGERYYYFSPSGTNAVSGYPEGAMITGEHYIPYTKGSERYLNYYFDTNGAMQNWTYPLPTSTVSGVAVEDYEPYFVNSRFAEWRVINGQNNQHNGLDLRARVPVEVKSATDGTVVFAGEASGMGNLIVIKSNVTAPNGNRLNIRYMHLSNYVVSKGQVVTAGIYLGKTGSTGTSQPHFHMDVNAHKITTTAVTGSNGQNPAAFFTTVTWKNKDPYGKAYSGYVD